MNQEMNQELQKKYLENQLNRISEESGLSQKEIVSSIINLYDTNEQKEFKIVEVEVTDDYKVNRPRNYALEIIQFTLGVGCLGCFCILSSCLKYLPELHQQIAIGISALVMLSLANKFGDNWIEEINRPTKKELTKVK